MVHRDIEPKHLGVDSTGHLGLLDFGCAVFLDQPAAPATPTYYSGVSGCPVLLTATGILPWAAAQGLR